MKGYDYWALGHVHQQEVLHEKPWVVFAGNLQGRHARETGAKGCTLVQVTDEKTTLTPVPVDVLRWEVCHLDVSDVGQAEEVVDRARWAVIQAIQHAEGRPLAMRFVIQGQCPVHAELYNHAERWINEIRAVATDAGLGNVWVEKVNLQTQAVRVNYLDEGPLGELMDTLRNLPQDSEILQTLSAEFRSLRNALPIEARVSERGGSIDPDNLETIRRLLSGVEELLLARLLA